MRSILIFTALYEPGFRGGGPIRSLKNMTDRLSEKFNFSVITSDRDLGDECSYRTINVNRWNVVGRLKVFYASPKFRSLWRFRLLMRESPYDILYLNSVFSVKFTLLPLLLQRWCDVPSASLIVAPRGEFSEGALKIKSWKKRPYIWVLRKMGVFDRVLWHASTEMERSDIQKAIGASGDSIHVARNLTPKALMSVVEKKEHKETTDALLRLCFVSRISKMKNLDFALQVLSKMECEIDFDIYGPKEDLEYWSDCAEIISTMPSNIRVRYCGVLSNSEVTQTISGYDLLFVPSRGENFGHIYVEAFSGGTPILISDRTPWRDLESKKLGWDIALNDQEEFCTALRAFAGLNQLERNSIRVNCIKFAHQIQNNLDAIEANEMLFLRAKSTERFANA